MQNRRIILACTTAAGAVGAAAVCIGLVHLMKVGTCASGISPYGIVRPCPTGTGAQIGLLGGGIVLSVFACIAAGMVSSGAWWYAYSLLFLSAGVTMLVNALTTQHAAAGAAFASWTIAAVFIPMGAWPLVGFGARWAGGAEQRRLDHRGVTAPATLSDVRRLETYPTGEVKVELIYSVQASNSGSFPLSRMVNLVAAEVPQRGQRVQIRYDPRHPADFTLLDDVPTVRVR